MTTDIRFNSWVLRYAPRALEPYFRLMRLDRPVPILLFLLPAFWGLFGTVGTCPPLSLLLIFAAGTFLMRSAGCVINDIIDRNLDPHVERTKNRPLASKELSLFQGVICLGLLLGLALPLLLMLPLKTIFLGFVLVVFVGAYPFMKRITYWPQIFLGITVNWGLLMGGITLTNNITFGTFFLFLTGVLWTLFYDTLYAHQDKKDDPFVRIKSSALRLHFKTKPFLRLLLCLKLLCLTGYWMTSFPPFLNWGNASVFFLTILGGLGSLLYTLETTNLDTPSSCLQAFKKSQVFGWLVLGGLIIKEVLS